MTRYSDCTECWYVPGETHMIDLIRPETGETFDFHKDEPAVKAEYPTAVRMNVDEVFRLIDEAANAKYIKPVSEIDADQFNYALEVLPPVGWRRVRGVESFKMSERLYADLTAIYAQCGERYFTLTDSINLSAEEIAERVAAYIATH